MIFEWACFMLLGGEVFDEDDDEEPPDILRKLFNIV